MECPMVWFEALGQHADNLEGFYGEVLGWRFDARRRRRKPALPAAPRRLRGGRAAAAPPWWVTFYAEVPDLDLAIAKARALGSRLLVPPTPHGDSVYAVVSDPEGHPVGLVA
jgi:predicted enzyme related to lactoylglutathione lyase